MFSARPITAASLSASPRSEPHRYSNSEIFRTLQLGGFLLPNEEARRHCVRLRQQSFCRSRSGDDQTVSGVVASEGTARDWIATTSKEGSFTIRLIQRLYVAIHVRRIHMIAAVIAPAARSTGLIGWFNRLDIRATASSTPAMINDNAIKIPACIATDLSVMITSLARIIH